MREDDPAFTARTIRHKEVQSPFATPDEDLWEVGGRAAGEATGVGSTAADTRPPDSTDERSAPATIEGEGDSTRIGRHPTAAVGAEQHAPRTSGANARLPMQEEPVAGVDLNLTRDIAAQSAPDGQWTPSRVATVEATMTAAVRTRQVQGNAGRINALSQQLNRCVAPTELRRNTIHERAVTAQMWDDTASHAADQTHSHRP